MALWKISAKGNINWGVGKVLTKGMYIEMSTTSTSSPLINSKYAESIAQAFNVKYSTRFEKGKMTGSFFTCERIG